jgi:hypothetical protein
MVAHQTSNLGVAGSIPAMSKSFIFFIFIIFFISIAQFRIDHIRNNFIFHLISVLTLMKSREFRKNYSLGGFASGAVMTSLWCESFELRQVFSIDFISTT